MEKIIWNKSLSVGVEEIDRQHKHLVDMINQMLSMNGVTVDSEVISETLTKMTEYADYHFDSEEQLMKKHGYPEFEAHHREHVNFMRKTAELSMSTMNYKKSIPTELLEYLKTWLIEHILQSDMQYKPFFEQRNIR